MRYLKQDTPIMKKLQRIFACMEEEGISLEITRMGDWILHVERDTRNLFLRDADQSDHEVSGSGIISLPPVYEYLVVLDGGYTKERTDE